ncbi:MULTISPECIES: thiamine phosphate synthase [unclassified Polaromonas]|uniref:thiamine phosphate synthase n=1 Tax=unclassified Polaromonas TaxID=2638319 RepID=UPI000F07DE6A|nr:MULTISPECIES: thiamine phosphate synthase [unclassified Polaromonas]AYQ29357.1 thiamine phosphate synthase [Polaromonas sp. SP1]QGJ19527.1 thiamine phosphate synthase [Polaromonas sp. Pch-P]
MARLNPDVLRLYLVTDQTLTRGRPLADVVAAAVQGGVTCVQLREKQLGTREFLAQALILKALLAPQGIPLVINDRIDIALACGADGVHLGQNDLPADEARKLLPPGVFIGWSVESMDDVQQSAALPVDYLGVSPIFSTPTKTDTKDPWGLEGLAVVRAATPLPLVAIGGVHAGNARDVLRAGANGLAVVSAICAAGDPQAAAAALRALCV